MIKIGTGEKKESGPDIFELGMKFHIILERRGVKPSEASSFFDLIKLLCIDI